MFDYYKGQKVVCVNNKGIDLNLLPTIPIEGKIYTVRGFLSAELAANKEAGIYVDEIIGNVGKNGVEHAFKMFRFIPLDIYEKQNSLINKIRKSVEVGDYDAALDHEENPYKVLVPSEV